MSSKLMIVRDWRLWVFRFAALLALVFSGLALSKFLLHGECNACTAAKFGLVLGPWVVVLLPWLGVGGALALLALSFCPGRRAAQLRISLSLVGGGLGLGLLFIQAGLLRSFCPTCYLVDAAFVLAAAMDARSGATMYELSREPDAA